MRSMALLVAFGDRVRDYRIICQIEDEEIMILVLEIGHRREIYR